MVLCEIFTLAKCVKGKLTGREHGDKRNVIAD